MSGSGLSLDKFYSFLEPHRFQGEIRTIVRERLEIELLENKITHQEYADSAPVSCRETRFSYFLIILIFVAACISVALALTGSIQEGEKLKLNTTLLQSTEGKLIEALAVKAGNDKEYVDNLLALYQARIDDRRRFSMDSHEEGLQAPLGIPAVLLDAGDSPVIPAEQHVQKLIQQKMTDLIETGAVLSSAGAGVDRTEFNALKAASSEEIKRRTEEKRREDIAVTGLINQLSVQAEKIAVSKMELYDLLNKKLTLREIVGSEAVKKTYPEMFGDIDSFFQNYAEVYSELGRKKTLEEVSALLKEIFPSSKLKEPNQ